ncbi:hypothetical protein BDW_04915 [Bdellovibrio bacteriovorus W]|nr:hypothetical protein BDW_04915 [Bdellovibrio bacteriovorus W]
MKQSLHTELNYDAGNLIVVLAKGNFIILSQEILQSMGLKKTEAAIEKYDELEWNVYQQREQKLIRESQFKTTKKRAS